MGSSWYILNVYAGSEAKVVEEIRETALRKGMESCLHDVIIPTESVQEMKRGARVKVERKIYPGYVLMCLDLTDDMRAIIINTPRVSGFLGSKNKPRPMSSDEVRRMLDQLNGVDLPVVISDWCVGDRVMLTDGPFSSMQGLIEEVDEEKQRVSVSVSIFGRPTPVEMEFHQIQRV